MSLAGLMRRIWQGHVAIAGWLLASGAVLAQPASPVTTPAAPLAGGSPALLGNYGDVQVLMIDLPNALQLANAGNPTIAVARARVQEALVALRATQLAWLPDLQGGAAYLRHDGEIQNSTGLVFPTSKSSLFVGGGAVLNLDTSQALFAPLVARRLAQAQSAAARTVTDNVQLDVALAYLSLLHVYGALAVNADTLGRAQELLTNAEAAKDAGLARSTADPPRARTEVEQRKLQRIDLEGQAAVASARLAQLLLLQPTVDLRPAEATVVPITLVPVNGPLDDLVAVGLMNRPELAESRSLVAAALARWRQARVGPFIPQFQVSYLAGDFGGGLNSSMADFNARGDGTAQMMWVFHNLGAGDVLAARGRRIQYNEANLHVIEVQAQVAAEVTSAAKLVRSRQRTLQLAQDSVLQATEMWRRLREAAFGTMGREMLFNAVEPLLAEQALDQARTHYLDEVIAYDQDQFRLYWAMGQPPLAALPQATAQPVEVTTTPPAYVPPAKAGK
jgi:outer membrane protein TolC